MKNIFLSQLLGCLIISTTMVYSQENQDPLVYDLDESTNIILTLLEQNMMQKLVIDTTPDQLDRLIKNFSPAEIAFESEALSCTLPVLLYFDDADGIDAMQPMLEDMARHEDRMKVVTVDADNLFRIAENTQIATLPTWVLIKDREILGKLAGTTERKKVDEFLSLVDY